MDKISEIELKDLLEKRMTRLSNKDMFWIDLKNNSNIKFSSYSIGEQNLLIDMPNKIQRDNFIKEFQKQNPSFDYFCSGNEIPEKYFEIYKDNKDYKYPNFGIPLFVAKINNISSLKDIYISILESFSVGKSELRIKNLEEMEYRIIHFIKSLSVEIIIINYDGEKLIPSKKLFSIFYALCRLSELCKISFNLFGSVSPRMFYSESRKVPVGSFYYIDGENNSDDVHFTTITMKLDEKKGKFVEVKEKEVDNVQK